MNCQAVEKNLLTADGLVENLKPMFCTRMRLGEFDPPELNPYSSIPMSVVLSADHRELAVQAACMSFVLLKNNNNMLPIVKRFTQLAVGIMHIGLARTKDSVAYGRQVIGHQPACDPGN